MARYLKEVLLGPGQAEDHGGVGRGHGQHIGVDAVPPGRDDQRRIDVDAEVYSVRGASLRDGQKINVDADAPREGDRDDNDWTEEKVEEKRKTGEE